PASPTPIAQPRRGSGYRVSESLPELIPSIQQVHQVLSDARLQTTGIYRFRPELLWTTGARHSLLPQFRT
ncbi:MAG TPA: hypothetical protein VM715_02600, partial [Candidatus Acidoferrum sp.]|nr:hypothetical protein [Candidatus Acidoferrum sp.]